MRTNSQGILNRTFTSNTDGHSVKLEFRKAVRGVSIIPVSWVGSDILASIVL